VRIPAIDLEPLHENAIRSASGESVFVRHRFSEKSKKGIKAFKHFQE